MHKVLCLSLTLALFCLIGCSDDDGPAGNGEIFTVDQFPGEVGNWWQYEMVDTLYNTAGPVPAVVYDTVRVEITKEIAARPPNLRNQIWTYHFSDSAVEQNVIVNPNYITIGDVILPDLSRASWPPIYWQFPLELGSGWSTSPVDTSTVTTFGIVDTPAGRFYDGYKIEKWVTAIGGAGPHETWIVPNVGIVAHRFGIFTGNDPIPDRSNWKLIDWFGN